MKIDSEFLFKEIEKLKIAEWEKEGLKSLVLAELSGKSAPQFREMLEAQVRRESE